MSFASAILRQHIVEFVRGTGIVTNGVVDNTSPSGPWTWTVPSGVCLLKVDGIGGGSGGAGGYNIGTALAGGGGGRSGGGIMGMDLTVIPNAVLTITLGAGGTGGAAGSDGTGGGRTTITGLTRPYLWRRTTQAGDRVEFQAGFQLGGGNTGTASAGGTGGGAGNAIVGRSTGTNNAVSPTNAGAISNYMQGSDGTALLSGAGWQYGGKTVLQGGGGGGGASTVTTTAGANGSGNGAGGNPYNAAFGFGSGAGIGDQSGGVSRGGGGVGGNSFLALGGVGGSNGGAGGNGGIGAGGGGGAGGAAGGNGGNGYLRFTYWRMD